MSARKKKVEMPYKKTHVAQPLAENVEAATKAYGGSKYEMIIVAAFRARQISKGTTPLVPLGHKPIVTALLEIEAGHIKADMMQ